LGVVGRVQGAVGEDLGGGDGGGAEVALGEEVRDGCVGGGWVRRVAEGRGDVERGEGVVDLRAEEVREVFGAVVGGGNRTGDPLAGRGRGVGG
jgi:hypothetical protein